MLAIKIERTLTKNRILELYLNQIYLGSGTYGVAAASNRYFSKNLNELDYAEVSYLAALPKAPNNYHPKRNYNEALQRRNWVLKRMYINKFIDKKTYFFEKEKQLIYTLKRHASVFVSDYYLEEIRKDVIELFTEDMLYGGGLSIRTSLNTNAQKIAIDSLKKGLKSYDKRHGYRGAILNYIEDDWSKHVKLNFQKPEERINKYKNLKWARKFISDSYIGPKIESAKEVFKINDIIYASKNEQNEILLEQIPKINGGIVVMDPYSGRVLAMSGGYDFKLSNFNRVLQAKRQPGSAFKPFVYLSALENGLKPNTLILDAPFVVDQGQKLGKWKPENYGKKFYGPTPLRKGIENSRNLMTVRIAQFLGMDKISEIAKRSGIMINMPEVLSMSLGAGETTLIDLTTAYAAFVNGGFKVEPILIDRIQDRRGKNIYSFDFGSCVNCNYPFLEENPKPSIDFSYTKIFSPVESYQMVSMLYGAVERGTGRRTKINGIEIAGKTGTTNNNSDAWFIGFTSDLIIGVYAGFDRPSTLGARETGSSVAVPIFKDFVNDYYIDKTSLPFKIPQGIELIKTDLETGEIKTSQIDNKTIYEAYRKDDKLISSNKTLIGKEGFQLIEIEETHEDEFVIY